MNGNIKNGLICIGLTIVSCLIVIGIVGVAVWQKDDFFGKWQGGLETPGVPTAKESGLKSLLGLDSSDNSNEVEVAGEDAAINSVVSDEEVASTSSAVTYISYRVHPGDMIGKIAERYGITQDTIISVNNITQSRLIQPGQYLKIPSKIGILYTVAKDGETVEDIAKSYEIDASECANLNKLAVNDSLPSGTTMFLPGAKMDWVKRQEINGDLFVKPIHSSYYLSSYYGWRSSPFNGKRTFHSGIDMAAYQGTSVYAALSGRVAATGYNAIYGNYIIVSHHSGYKTLYGHLSKILVSKGQSVATSSKIGLVGSTGMSTGPHLHFTVYKNGKTVNPLAYIK